MAEKIINERDTKLAQWLGEAYAKEAELEARPQGAHRLTEKQSYKKRLRQHLSETRDHKRRVGSRIKKLGGTPTTAPNIPAVPTAVGEAAGKAVAAVKGQVGDGARAHHRAGRDAPAQRPGRAPGGARRDRDLHPDRDARHRGR